MNRVSDAGVSVVQPAASVAKRSRDSSDSVIADFAAIGAGRIGNAKSRSTRNSQKNKKFFATDYDEVVQPLGLIAGEGVFPLLVARGARAAGRRVVCAALTGSATAQLRDECDRFAWVGVTRLSRWIKFLRREGVSEAIMVGRVLKTRMYDPRNYFRY